jgi:amidase
MSCLRVRITFDDTYSLLRNPLAGHPDQEQLLRASRDRPSQETYEAVKQHMTAVSKVNGIDKLFREQNLNLLAFPQDSLMIYMSAASGMVK